MADDAGAVWRFPYEQRDASTITDRVENAVGSDLQFIRINGTLVGGLAGIVIHTVGLLI